MRRWWRREEIQESQGPRVQRSKGPMDPLKVKFKYELDSKEGPSCYYNSQICSFLDKGWSFKEEKYCETIIYFIAFISEVEEPFVVYIFQSSHNYQW